MQKTTFLLLLFVPFLALGQITNGTFDTTIDGWVSQNSATISHDATTGADANGSLKIVAASANNSGAKIDPSAAPPSAGNYILTFKVKGTADTEIRGDVFQGSFIGGTAYKIKATDVWEEYTTTFNNLTADNANIRIISRTADATFHIDDVKFLQTATEDSYVSNSDFETGTLDNWTADGPDVSLSSAAGNSSATAAVLTFDQDISGNNFLTNTEYDFGETVSPSEVSVSLDIKSNNTNMEIQVVFITFDAAGTQVELATTGKKSPATADTWETISFNKTITASFNKIQVRLKIKDSSTANSGDTVAFDNVISSFSYPVLNVEKNTIFNKVTVYPNPTNGTIHIKTKDKLQKLQLFNIIGRKVFETTNLTNNQVNFSHVNAGAYILRLIDSNNNTKSQKLIIN